MEKIALFYGTYTGVTGMVAEKIANELGREYIDVYNICSDGEKMSQYNKLIIGTSTWSIGELQEDWDAFMPKLQNMDFNGKTVALFGTGDQVGYPDTFLDGMGMLYETFQYRGAKFIGFWPTVGYDFTSPLPLLDHDHFVGLAIDEDNQSDLTDERVKKWCALIRKDLGIPEK
ncbi:MAG TPA: flavodoxin [Succinivibrionaceae bacterium]|nr:flavodoxin [Succinivibrionaceae bacterium]